VIGGVPQYEITMSEVRQELHSQLPDTDVWVYNGSYPGPTIEAREGEPISVKYINDLPSLHYLNVDECPHGPNYWQNSTRTVVHLHGGHVPAGVDGHPEQTIMPGEFDVFDYPNTQISTTLWYHDHALGITRLNVQMGLAAFYIIRGDDEDALGLPSGTNEIPLVIQDREFNDDGTFFYPPVLQTTFFGDKILVNGKVWPFLNVKRGKYRFRVLNGSNSRVYTLSLSNGAQFQLIGTDGGLITSPRTLSDVTIAPAERADIVIDFAGYAPGTEIILKNSARAPFPNGSPNVPPNVMKFIVTTEAGHTGVIPGLLRTVDPILDAVAETRYFNLIRVTPTENPPEICGGGEWLIESHDAPPTDPQSNVIGSHWDDISEFPELGTTEIWEFYNSTNIMHPMHVHLVMFQVLDRTDLNTAQSLPLSEYERDAWKDTVMALPQTRTRIIARYEDYSGKFPFHCHILEHEDHEMMRQFQATFPPCVPNGICEPGEDCLSCSDCAVVSGALCGNGLCEIGDGEDCVSCPEDCAGRDKGNSQYCCGGDDPQTGVDCSDARCTDGFFCRDSARLQACCGDTLCEGEETNANCSVDCDVICVPEGNREKGNDCNDGIDNDCDGFTDGADTDCGGTGCTPTTVSCTDGVDNDCDGLIDCADSDGDEDCSTDPACTCVITEDPEVTTCFDGLDNDCDTSIDCADSSCDGAVNGTCDTGQQGICGPGTFQCQGGAQQCVADTPPQTEGPPADPTCSDGDDNDCDGLTDGNDPDCGVCVPTTDNEKGGKKCRDGIDNDCDGLIDGADPGCQ
jgi:spore coat protein A